jgi:hypothetical protein
LDFHWLEFFQKVSAPLAVLVGGAWVLMNYLRGRTHAPRLQVEVEAEVVTSGTQKFLVATIHVKNVGLSMITLGTGTGPSGCALLVAPLREHEPIPDLFEGSWEAIRAFDILENHRTIEPGLMINQQKLICLPDAIRDAYLVRVRVLAHALSWSAVAIAIVDTRSEGGSG